MTVLQSLRDGVRSTVQAFDPGKAQAFAGFGKKCCGLRQSRPFARSMPERLSDYGLFTMRLAALAYKVFWTDFKGKEMGIFGNILAKLGIGESKSPEPVEAPHATTAASSTPAASTPAPVAVSEVDVAGKLEALASAHAEKLNWKVSIVDLLKLLNLDSSFATRKNLAVELGCPADKMGDSAEMNMWLHQAVLRKLAENGGKIPADLLK